MDHQNADAAVDAGDGRYISNEIEFKVVIECHIIRIDRRKIEQRVAIGRRMNNKLGSDIAGCSGPVFDEY